MRIYFATWLTDRTLGTSLTKHNGQKRLLSYHFLLEQEVSTDQLKEYVETGEADIRKNKPEK